MSADGSVRSGKGVVVSLDLRRGTAVAQVGARRIFIPRQCLLDAGIELAVGDAVEVVFDELRLNRAESIRRVEETPRPVAARGRAKFCGSNSAETLNAKTNGLRGNKSGRNSEYCLFSFLALV